MKTDRVEVVVRMTADLRDRLNQAAHDRGISRSLLASRAIADFLDNIASVEEVLGMRGSAAADFADEIKVGGTD